MVECDGDTYILDAAEDAGALRRQLGLRGGAMLQQAVRNVMLLALARTHSWPLDDST